MTPSETKVGKTLSDLTTKRAILLMFSVMVSLPLFSYETYWSDKTSYETGCSMIVSRYYSGESDTTFYITDFVNFHRGERMPVVSLALDGQEVFQSGKDYHEYRDEELKIYLAENS